MTDIVNDLRTALAERQKVMKGGGELYRRAADEIERLRDVNDQSTAALEAAEKRAEAWKRLCGSTETATTEVIEERDALAAVVEKVRAEVEGESRWFRHRAGRVLDNLATAPADALREVKAEAWQEGAYRVYNSISADEAEWWWSDWANENPYRAREEQDR